MDIHLVSQLRRQGQNAEFYNDKLTVLIAPQKEKCLDDPTPSPFHHASHERYGLFTVYHKEPKLERRVVRGCQNFFH